MVCVCVCVLHSLEGILSGLCTCLVATFQKLCNAEYGAFNPSVIVTVFLKDSPCHNG